LNFLCGAFPLCLPVSPFVEHKSGQLQGRLRAEKPTMEIRLISLISLVSFDS